MAGANEIMITWGLYLQDHLMCEINGHKLTAGAILAQEEFIYAHSEDFPSFKAKELQMVAKELKKPGSTTMTEEGFVFGGEKYSKLEGNEGMIVGVGQVGSNIVFRTTRTTIVVGIFKPELTGPNSAAICTQIVENLANFFAGRNL